MSSTTKRDVKGRFSGEHPDRKYAFGRTKKRPKKFLGNTSKDSTTPVVSTSARKLASAPKIQSDSSTKNRLIDINILFSEFEKTLCCNQCHGSIKLSESSVQGLGFKIVVTCTDCGKIVDINSCQKVGSKNQVYEINRRAVLAARALGHGHAGLSTFCALIDTHKPLSQKAFDKTNKLINKASEKIAKTSMKAAVAEEKEATPNAQGLDISGDGSWRKKGFSSLQGFASIIGNKTGKVLDVSIKNSFCQACSEWESKKNTFQYEEWFANHQSTCSANHKGSAGKMEVDGIVQIFERSEKEYNVKYHRYIGDGDSKVFKAVSESKPYGDSLEIEKRECIAHVQKRMGTRLRNLKKSLAGKKLTDDKPIGGRGRLTGQSIDKMSMYYGKAIRSNPNSVDGMYRAIWASYYHLQSTDANPQHHFCPPGSNSWCAWQKFQSTERTAPFKHKNSMPATVMEEIRPIYVDLSKRELLERCLGGFTQNSNECFNSTVWKLVPKTSFSGLSVFEIGVFAAVTMFNDGNVGLLRILIALGIEPGHAAVRWAKKKDKTRVADAQKQAQARTKEARSARRSQRQQQEDAFYGPGAH